MNRPRRPTQFPARRRPSGPPGGGPRDGGFSGPRRRTALDVVPQTIEPPFKVLGTGADRQAITAGAQPMEMVVIQGFTREIEDSFQKFTGRPDDFWNDQARLIEVARKLDELLFSIQSRKK
jgi:hypothetical protein